MLQDLGDNFTETSPEVEKVWDEFWKELVCDPDGRVNIPQVKKELYDYHNMLEEIPKVFCEVTGGNISKPNTKAFEVISEYNRCVDKLIDEAVAEAIYKYGKE